MSNVSYRNLYEEFNRRRKACFPGQSKSKVDSQASKNFEFMPDDAQLLLEKVWNDLRTMTYGISHLATLQKRQRDFHFRSDNEEKHESEELQAWTRKMSGILRNFQRHLRLLDSSISGMKGCKMRVCKNLKLQLALKVEDLRELFNRNHLDHLEFVHQREERKRITRKRDSFEEDAPLASTDGQGRDHMIERYLERGLSMAEMSMLLDHEQITKEREQQMHEVTRAISDLNDLFCDTQMLVVTQGTILDTIKYHLQDTSHRIEAGVHDLSKAMSYGESQNIYKIVYFILLVLIICFLFTTLIRARMR